MGGGALGGLFGGVPGATAGGALGASLGGGLGRIIGHGDYHVQSNSLVKMHNGQSAAQFMNSGKGIEICHREYLGDISGSTDFVNHALNINPGLGSSFPWLSKVANNFEQYEFLGLVFEYRPSSGVIAGASAALGMVVFATNYDCLDPDFTSKQDMESYQFCTSSVPYQDMSHPVECAARESRDRVLFVRGGEPPVGSDRRLYDLGRFQYATRGMPSSYTCGELWVTYHVRLLKPRINPTYYAPALHLASYSAASVPAAPFITMQVSYDSGGWFTGLNPKIEVGNAHVALFQYGKYSVTLAWTRAVGTITGPPVISSPGAHILFDLDYSAATTNSVTAYTGTTATCVFTVDVTAPGSVATNAFHVQGPTGMTSSFVDVIIVPLPTAFV